LAPADVEEHNCWAFLVEAKRSERQRMAQRCLQYWGQEVGWDSDADQTMARMVGDPAELSRICAELNAKTQRYQNLSFGSRGFRLRAVCGGGAELAAIRRLARPAL